MEEGGLLRVVRVEEGSSQARRGLQKEGGGGEIERGGRRGIKGGECR